MTQYRVDFTREARAQADAVEAWWVENRPSAPTMFRDELVAAVRLLSVSPFLGAQYAAAPMPGVRRILIGRSRYHVYWEVNRAAQAVTIAAVWYAERGTGPPL